MSNKQTSDAVEVVAIVVADLLRLVPQDLRAAVLAAAKEINDDREHAPPEIDLTRLAPEDERHWDQIARLKARVVVTFVRDITNNHSPEDAARILFSRQPGVPGSGLLFDYLRRPLNVMNRSD
jgi:hypothetical protein